MRTWHDTLARLLVATTLLAAFLVGCDTAPAGTAGPGSGDTVAPDATDPDPTPPDPPVVVPPTGDGTAPYLDERIFPAVGSSEFITANEKEQLSTGTGDHSYNRGVGADEAFDNDGAAGAGDPSADPAPPSEPQPMPEPDPTREIVEADIFKVEGTLLYVLNRFRGLVIIDLAEPDAPAIVGRLPFQALPVDMYVRDGRAFIVMSDYFVYWQFDPDADPHGFHGSRVLIADVSDPSAPVELGSLPVDGEVTDTRMVGDVLYAVSKRNPEYWRYNTADWEDRTWVVSLNVSDPQNIHEIERIEFAGTSTLIHVAHHAIFVAAVDPNYYVYSADFEQESLITYVDISDPNGDLQERGAIYVPGHIADKFKMDFHDRALRVMTQRWAGSSDNTLFVVDVSFPDTPAIIGQVPVTTADGTYLQASRFDGVRGYAMTSRWNSSTQIRELHTFDLADPANPRRMASQAIQTNISHIIARGERLLTLGRKNVSNASRVAVEVYDVSDLAAPRLLSQVALGDRYSYSGAISDYKAFRVIDELGLILVPLSYWTGTTHFEGTQLVQLDGDALRERGQIAAVSQVLRAFVVGDRLVAFSEQQVQVIDATDLDRPIVTANLYLVRNVLEVFDVQGYQVQLVGDVLNGGYFFEVLPFGPADDAPAVARLDLPFTGQPFCIRDGDVFHLVGFEPTKGQTIRNADFRDVDAPALVGLLEFSNEIDSFYQPGYSFYYYYWNLSSGLPIDNAIVPFTERHIRELPTGRREWQSELRLVDLTDIDNPRLSPARIPMNDYPFVNKVTHGRVMHSTHVEQALDEDGATLYFHVRSFVDRIDVSDPDAPVVLPSLNVPGHLVDVSADGLTLYTVDYQWDDFGRRRNALCTLRVEGDEAVLMEVIPVADQVNRAAFRDRTIWLAAHKYPWWGVHADTATSRQPYTVLHRFAVGDDGALVAATDARLHGYHFDLLDVEGARVYLGSRWPYGLLVLDATDPAAPLILHAARSIGYISRIVVHDDFVYTPLGWYGVHRYGVSAD